jgi:hypothetical protein
LCTRKKRDIEHIIVSKGTPRTRTTNTVNYFSQWVVFLLLVGGDIFVFSTTFLQVCLRVFEYQKMRQAKEGSKTLLKNIIRGYFVWWEINFRVEKPARE